MNIFDIDKKLFKNISKNLHGFSLGELLVVIVIVSLLAIAIIMAYQTQVAKANDAKRKEDLNKYKIAFEDYYNDHNCYPTQAMWEACTCESACLSPYMEKFLCDPTTKQEYYYVQLTDCKGYQLYTKLENKGDPDITRVGCSWSEGCGYDIPLSLYNYGIAVGGSLTAADFNPNTTPTPTSVYAPGCERIPGEDFHACNTNGECNGHPSSDFPDRCPVGFRTGNCCVASGCPESIWCKW